MHGWLICKVDGQLVHSVLYGQFSKELLPPSKGWIFLSRDPDSKTIAEDQSINGVDDPDADGIHGTTNKSIVSAYDNHHREVNLFATGLPTSDWSACMSYTPSAELTVELVLLHSDRDPTAWPERYYSVKNCPFAEANGRYMLRGYMNDAPLYRNIREWVLVRVPLPEIPELGISAAGSYAMQAGTSISETFHQARWLTMSCCIVVSM